MTVDQVLAHMNVAYSIAFEPEKHKKPNFIAMFFLNLLDSSYWVLGSFTNLSSPTKSNPPLKICSQYRKQTDIPRRFCKCANW